jgi:hypothetical protein
VGWEATVDRAVDGAILIIASIILYVLLRTTSLLEAYGYYYNYSALYLTDRRYAWVSIIIGYVFAFCVGSIIGAYVTLNPQLTARITGGLASAFVIWPRFMNIYDEVGQYANSNLIYIDTILAVVYIFSFVYCTGAGSLFGNWWYEHKLSGQFPNLRKFITESALAIIHGGVGAAIATWVLASFRVPG